MQRRTLNNLGRFVDGWAHLIEGEAGKASVIRERLRLALMAREMPDVSITPIQVRGNNQEPDRPYLLTSTPAGFTTITCIREHGKDLYVSWRTYHSLPNIFAAIPIAGPVVLLAIWFAVFSGADYLYSRFKYREAWQAYNAWVDAKYARVLISIIVGAAVLYIGGYLENKRNERATLQNKQRGITGLLVIIILAAITAIVVWIIYPSYVRFPPPSPKPFIFSYSFTARLLAATAIVVWGTVMLILYKTFSPDRSLMEFISVFDDDDAIAMSLSVHKSLVHVLDQTGIDISELRLHNEMIQVRKGEPI